MRLFRVVYFSENHLEYDTGAVTNQLQSILNKSQSNNSRDGVKGALIFDDLWFLQTLEGDRETIWRTIDRIRKDERHDSLTVVDARDIEKREFGRWSMKLVTRTKDTAPVLDEFSANGRLNVRTMTLDALLNVLRRLTEAANEEESKPILTTKPEASNRRT